jgi:hypothetical protein
MSDSRGGGGHTNLSNFKNILGGNKNFWVDRIVKVSIPNVNKLIAGDIPWHNLATAFNNLYSVWLKIIIADGVTILDVRLYNKTELYSNNCFHISPVVYLK